MKITEITTRRLRLGAEPWFAPRAIPSGHVPYWEFPFTTLHTDAGIDGYTMDYGPLGQGRGSAYAVHDIFYYDLVGQDPLKPYGRTWMSRCGISKAKWQACPSPCCWASIAIGCRSIRLARRRPLVR
jgi:hypothetical protein